MSIKEQTDEEKAASRRGRRSRRKGHDFERWLVNLLKESLPGGVTVARGLQSKGGKACADVGVWLEDVPIAHFECKIGKRPNIKDALEQAVCDAKLGAVPIACTKADRHLPLVTLYLDDFLQFLEAFLSWTPEKTEGT